MDSALIEKRYEVRMWVYIDATSKESAKKIIEDWLDIAEENQNLPDNANIQVVDILLKEKDE